MTGSPVQPLNTCTVDAEVEHNEELMGLTAGAADPGDDEGLPDPLLEHRIAAAADLARHEERIRVAAMGALRRWTDLVRAAVLGEGTLTAAAGEVPPDANAVPPLSAQWSTILTDTVDAELTGMLGEVFTGILGEETTVSARPWQESYIAEVHNRLTGVADQTFDLIRDVIADGQATGADIPTLRGLISDVLATRGESTWAGRAQTIARTEAVSAMNGGQLQAWKVQAAQTGEVREKAFLATIDRRTRRSHWRADGQRVALDAKFVVGHAQLDHPGDPRGPAEETVNCRCAMLILDADEELPDTADRQLRPAGEVQAEIDRRAAEGDLRASEDPDAVAGPRAARQQESAGPQVGGYIAGPRRSFDEWDLGSYQAFDFAQPVNRGLLDMWHEQGFTAKPTVVDADELDRLIAGGAQEVFRGVEGYGASTARDRLVDFVESEEPWTGRGIYGNGTYFSTSLDEAVGYARHSKENVMRAALRPQARVIDHADLVAMLTTDEQVQALVAANPSLRVDVSRLATSLGYDAIRAVERKAGFRDGQAFAEDVPQFSVLNRSAVVVERLPEEAVLEEAAEGLGALGDMELMTRINAGAAAPAELMELMAEMQKRMAAGLWGTR